MPQNSVQRRRSKAWRVDVTAYPPCSSRLVHAI